MDYGRHFCLSFHLKGVCKSHFGGHHSHRLLSQSEFGWLSEWRAGFYIWKEAPPVREVDAGNLSQASTLLARTN